MRKFRIAVCDDEENTIDVICSVVQSAFGKSSVPVGIDTFSSAEALGRRLRSQIYDLLFLDIDMPRLDGIALGERLRRAGDNTEIIYVSNREDRVFEALRIHPFGFVRKSNFLNDITAAIRNFLSSVSSRDVSSLTVQGKGGIVTVKIAETVYFEGAGKFQLMHVTGKTEPLSVYRAMEKLEEDLSSFGFIRIHKGMLVNFRFISRILTGGVELTTGETLPLSRRKATDIKEKYLALLRGSGSVML